MGLSRQLLNVNFYFYFKHRKIFPVEITFTLQTCQIRLTSQKHKLHCVYSTVMFTFSLSILKMILSNIIWADYSLYHRTIFIHSSWIISSTAGIRLGLIIPVFLYSWMYFVLTESELRTCSACRQHLSHVFWFLVGFEQNTCAEIKLLMNDRQTERWVQPSQQVREAAGRVWHQQHTVRLAFSSSAFSR